MTCMMMNCVSCRQHAQASLGAVQAAASTVAAMTAPQIRRTTAEQATQYVLGDLDSEPVAFLPSHPYHQKRSTEPSFALPVTEEESIGLLSEGTSGQRGAAPGRHASRGQHSTALTGQQSPSIFPSKSSNASRITKQPFSEISYSELESNVKAAEEDAKQSRESVYSPWSGQQQQQHLPVVQHGDSSVAPDSISIAVSAGSVQEQAQSALHSIQAVHEGCHQRAH